MKKCPSCGKNTYVISIFGSICSSCYYTPEDTLSPKLAKEGIMMTTNNERVYGVKDGKLVKDMPWQQKYCKEFGLCEDGLKCQCKRELKFIEKLIQEEVDKTKAEIKQLIVEEINIERVSKAGKTSRLTSLYNKIK